MSTHRPTICLTMIVKDEAGVMERCVDSVRDVIDHWVICDTGSTDGTQELIQRSLEGVPGELHERPWVNFGHNRSELLRLARGKADYLLLLDADWTVDVEPGALDDLTADSYWVRHGGDAEFLNKRLVSGKLDWRYEGAVHEYITTDDPDRVEQLEGVVIYHWGDGGGHGVRWERDAKLLEQELERDPGNARAAFYLAQTHRDLGHNERAIELYRARAAMGGWDEEVYHSLYEVGVLSATLGEWPAAMDALVEAWEFRPQRLEAAYQLAYNLRSRRQYRAAHQFASLAQGPAVLETPADLLFVQPWIYQWGLLFEYSITAYWVGDHDASIAACDRLLELEGLPESHRNQTRLNRQEAIKAKVQQAKARSGPPQADWSLGNKHRATSVAGAKRARPGGELDDPSARLASLLGMSVSEVRQRLLSPGPAVDVQIAALGDWALRVRAGTSDVVRLDETFNAKQHLPAGRLDEPNLIVDLGCEIGTTIADMARRYPSADFIGVERDRASVDLCVHNLRPIKDRLTLVGAAIAVTNGRVAYRPTAVQPGNGTAAHEEEIAIALSLDTLLKRAAPDRAVDYLKMDIGAAGSDVLKAGGQWPERVRAMKLRVSAGYGVAEAVADLRALGFECDTSDTTAPWVWARRDF